jgi:hypothetical protein
MGWYYADSEEAERWHLVSASNLDEAIAAARYDGLCGADEGAPFVVAEAEQQSWRYDCFDDLSDAFDCANEELGDGDGDPPSIEAGLATKVGVKGQVEKLLQATLRGWVEANGKPAAWSLIFKDYHRVPATEEWHRREQGIA